MDRLWSTGGGRRLGSGGTGCSGLASDGVAATEERDRCSDGKRALAHAECTGRRRRVDGDHPSARAGAPPHGHLEPGQVLGARGPPPEPAESAQVERKFPVVSVDRGQIGTPRTMPVPAAGTHQLRGGWTSACISLAPEREARVGGTQAQMSAGSTAPIGADRAAQDCLLGAEGMDAPGIDES